MDGLILKPPQPDRTIEIARSFSYKLNVGNYENREFFCSQKTECLESEAEVASERMYEFCLRQVLKAVAEYIRLREERLQRVGVINQKEIA